jgi:DNA primase
MGSYTNLDLRVVIDLPRKDLDESLNLVGKEELLSKVQSSKKIIHFIFERIANNYFEAIKKDDDISKKEIIDELLKILLSIKDPIDFREYTKFISHKLKIEEDVISLKLKEKQKKDKQIPKWEREANKKESRKEENEPLKMHLNERFKHAELELILLYIISFPNCNEIRNELSSIDFLDDKHKLIKESLDNISDKDIKPLDVIEQLIIEFNEYKHLMSIISELSLKLEDNLDENEYLKNKDKILKEAKEWMSWWVTNKRHMKDLTEELKECKNNDDENRILSQMMDVIRKHKK